MISHPIAEGFYRDRLPDDVIETVSRHRSFAEIVAELGEQHEAHVRAIDAAISKATLPTDKGGV